MSKKEEFIARIEKQIRVEEDYTKSLEDGKHRLSRSKYLVLIPLILLILVGMYLCVHNFQPGHILMLWVVGSFFLYMFYAFLMMIPSIGSDANVNIFDKKFRVYVREFLRLVNILRTVRKNPVTLIEFFWNAFLINTKPMVKGFSILYFTDLICALVMKVSGIIDWMTFFLLVGQIVVILIFYSRILAAKPGTPGFFTGKGIPELSGHASVGSVKVWLYIGLFTIITGFILVGAMMFPGLTLGEYLNNLSLVPGEFPFLLALIMITQGLILRYFHGVESRKLMNTLNGNHLSILKDDLLPRVNAATPEQLPELKREFLLFSMNKLMVQEFFYRFPAYTLMPNLLLALDPVAQDILTETGEDKKIKNLL